MNTTRNEKDYTIFSESDMLAETYILDHKLRIHQNNGNYLSGSEHKCYFDRHPLGDSEHV